LIILTAHQPVYLPWIGLFHKIALADKFCFFDNVQYQPKNWNNRNKIKSNQNNVIMLTVPVLRKDYLRKSYLDIQINNNVNWQKKHWRTIELNYKNSPYFGKYAEGLKKFYEIEWEYLAELNYEMLLYFLEVLAIDIPVVRMEDYFFKGSKKELVLDMCLQLNADVYIFGEKGEDYADVEKFNECGIVVYFQKYNHPKYRQYKGEFISHLSVVDLLFNWGERSKEIIMSNNITKSELIEKVN
jgi:hypothetical protein